jgi:hypothetical protein
MTARDSAETVQNQRFDAFRYAKSCRNEFSVGTVETHGMAGRLRVLGRRQLCFVIWSSRQMRNSFLVVSSDDDRESYYPI